MSKKPVPIVIPSHLRAGQVKTLETVLDPDMAIVCIPKAQEDDYRDKDPDFQYDVHPDDIVGLAPKRQYIYDKYGDVFMMDDDLTVAHHFEHKVGEKACRLVPNEVWDVVQRLYLEACSLGVYLFGLSPYADIRVYDCCNPYKLTGFVVGGNMGLRAGAKFKFNAAITAADDYWISALNAHYHRKALIDLRYKVTSNGKTFINPGGTAAIRTLETEKRDTELLQKFFGEDAIRIKKRTPMSKGKSGAHEYQRALWLPF